MECITKAQSFWQNESSCLGFMWNQGWGSSHNGVKKCTSTRLTAKPANDWEIYLKKCKKGIDSIKILDQEIGSFYTDYLDWHVIDISISFYFCYD